MAEHTCLYCNRRFRRRGNHPYKYCCREHSFIATQPHQYSSRGKIPDGQPMSLRTQYRRRRALGLTHPANPIPIPEDFFSNWSDELAWLLGLIWSDGHLLGNNIEICSKDLQLIDLILALVEGSRYGLKNQGRHIKATLWSIPFIRFLRSLGLTPRKSLTIIWPNIPEAYTGAFMRGLIDGDGSVFLTCSRPSQKVADLHVQFVTASPFLKDGVSQWLSRNTINYSLSEARNIKRPNYAPIWRFSVNQIASLRCLYWILYPHENVPCLHRKRIPYMLWMETPRFTPQESRRVGLQQLLS